MSMASFAKFGKFEWDRAGYQALMNSSAVQNIVSSKADAVKSAADSMMTEDGYRRGAHEVKPFAGKIATGRVVRTKTDHARRAQAKRKTLTKAMKKSKG